jgi:RNA polymerase sigma-70 factor (ECF subfamily)
MDTTPTDEELMAAYAAGDEVAFRQLFRRHAPHLLRRLGQRPLGPEDARELVQQSFLHLHQARALFDPARSFGPWFLTIAYNVRREHLRRRGRRPEARLEHDPPASPRGDRLELAERARGLRRALGEIPDKQREVIVLHWFEGLSFAAVAARLGLTPSAAKVRAHRGYKALRRALEAAPARLPYQSVGA